MNANCYYVVEYMRFMLGGYRYEIQYGEPPEYCIFYGSYQDCKNYIVNIQEE